MLFNMCALSLNINTYGMEVEYYHYDHGMLKSRTFR